MSIDTPRSPENNANGRFRRALRLALASSLLTFLPADTATRDVPVQEENCDYLFEGIRILPPGSPKKPRKPKEKTDDHFHRPSPKQPDSRNSEPFKLG